MRTKTEATGVVRGLLTALTVALAALALASSAQATPYEQVGCFAGSCTPVSGEEFPEESQLGGVGGLAVNYTGGGGAVKGTVYAATRTQTQTRVAMFEPKSEGLEFVEAWVVTENGGSYEVCGPAGELPNGEVSHPNCSPQPNVLPGKVDVDIDESTGNVYVLSPNNPGTKAVAVYSSDGGEEVARFGEKSPVGEAVSASPEKIHESPYPGGLAVNDDGEVYVFDVNNFGAFYRRLMVFKPESPGDYAHYVYAGEMLAASGVGGVFPSGPVLDQSGNIYVGGDTEGEDIEQFAPEAPVAFPASSHAPPLCTFNYNKSGITAVTVNPLTGEPFFFTYKKEETKKWVRSLGPCNPETGRFEGPKGEEITGRFEVAPERDDLWGMAFDPMRELSPGRPAGVFYAGASSEVPSSGVGKGEPGQRSLGYVFAGPVVFEESPPSVKAQSVAKVTQTSAQLRATANPSGFETSYRFQYLTQAEYEEAGEGFEGAEEAPFGGAVLGGGKGNLTATASIAALEPDTSYRYRVVLQSNCATGEPERVCEVDGEARSFRTFPLEAPGLPDERAWELVSPAQKDGGQVLPADPRISSCANVKCKPGATYQHFPMQSSPYGDAVAYEGTPFGVQGALAENQYVSRRTDSGWLTANPTPLLRGASESGYRFLSTELERAVIGQPSPALSPEAPAGYENLYSQPIANPLLLEPLVKQAPVHRPPSGVGAWALRFAGASADGSRIFFSANDALTGETPVAPPAQDEGAGKFNLYEWSAGELALVNVKPGNTEALAGARFGGGPLGNAVSADGSTVFWSDEAGQAYARIGSTETKKLQDPGRFLTSSEDGSLALLRDGCLYALTSEECTDLTQGNGGFEGIVGQADDLSHVYFVDTAVLTGEEENSEGAKAQPGAKNLYAWVEGTTRFVATLLPGDNETAYVGDWEFSPSERTAEASPGGRYVAFLSQAQLTGYDNEGPCQEISGTGKFLQSPCREVFIYDSQTAALRCVSCNPSGTKPLGWGTLRRIMVGPSTPAPPHYLTDAGRLFFDSQDSLVPADTNEGVEDVYGWEPQGVGSCEREEGCVSLLSGGRENFDSNFLTADDSGDNVFFTTRESLVASDTDEQIDLYDARVGGGFDSEAELPSQPCQGEGCQPPPAQGAEAPPSSVSYHGAGNLKPTAARCAKGKVKRKGRCVKRHQHAKKGQKNRPSHAKKGGRR